MFKIDFADILGGLLFFVIVLKGNRGGDDLGEERWGEGPEEWREGKLRKGCNVFLL